MRKFLPIFSVLLLSACATTNMSNKDINVRAVTKTGATEYDGHKDLSLAQKAVQDGDPAKAFTLYQSLVFRLARTDELRPKVKLGLADTALTLSAQTPQLAEQAKQIYRSLAMNENLETGLRDKAKTGLLLLEIEDMAPEKAQTRIKDRLKTQSRDVRLWNALGHIYDSEEMWLDALDTYVQALRVSKQNGTNPASAINNIGMSLLMQGRYTEALSKFEQAHKAAPGKQVFDNNRRLALILDGHLDRAVLGLSKIEQAQVYNDAGVLAARSGHRERAESFYRQALELSPTWFALAQTNLEALLEDTKHNKQTQPDKEVTKIAANPPKNTLPTPRLAPRKSEARHLVPHLLASK